MSKPKNSTQPMQIFAVVVAVAFVMLAVVVSFALGSNNSIEPNGSTASVVSISDGVQVIDVTAKGGYAPGFIRANAGQETVLRMNTKNTFDCSAAFTIPSKGISKFLPPNGQTEFALGTFEAGSVVNATCSMGMYSFRIEFV